MDKEDRRELKNFAEGKSFWDLRGFVMHEGEELERKNAEKVLMAVERFINTQAPRFLSMEPPSAYSPPISEWC